ncbi:hypothetical protein QWZ06_25755 [Chryseobacterium tructae]|uniref:Uncharacterized protein n=1 Tax=Chryseobacterium tructae TaxID=1037380 RepID=A0ABV7XPL1_9FLAO|nr:hypothetical protein [Chryseobacterium tructae]MDN3695387.1 hypothetical protein [Chryseobacterium tructae]
MKYLFQNKRVFFILLFLFSGLRAQKILVINNTNNSIIVKNGKKEMPLKSLDKKEFTETDRISIHIPDELTQNINLFLEPKEKLNIVVDKDKKFIYTGDHSALHEYINERLALETYGKLDTYYSIEDKKNLGELKNVSELLLVDILKKSKLSNILISQDDKHSVKRLKNYVKYLWLYTLFITIDRQNLEKTFKKGALNYYYKKYIETDIPRFSCTTFLQYKVIEVLAKNKSILSAELPTYPIVEHTDEDNINQYLPQNCQKQYFEQKYNYLEHINGHNKEYYKKVLTEKFNEE